VRIKWDSANNTQSMVLGTWWTFNIWKFLFVIILLSADPTTFQCLNFFSNSPTVELYLIITLSDEDFDFSPENEKVKEFSFYGFEMYFT
jgi:hypothetical protein